MQAGREPRIKKSQNCRNPYVVQVALLTSIRTCSVRATNRTTHGQSQHHNQSRRADVCTCVHVCVCVCSQRQLATTEGCSHMQPDNQSCAALCCAARCITGPVYGCPRGVTTSTALGPVSPRIGVPYRYSSFPSGPVQQRSARHPTFTMSHALLIRAYPHMHARTLRGTISIR